jgi:molybdopterin-containing oxidoreductase family iron-sulfur binding subunit
MRADRNGGAGFSLRLDRKSFLRFLGLPFLAAGANKPVRGASPNALKARRWAMVVDIQKCRKEEGCDLCIAACHHTHNVPPIRRPGHEVKWIWKEPFEHVFPTQKTEHTLEQFARAPVMVFCNHCDSPPCTRVCPTKATWKREDGIVMMDWHRCIGCRYCVAACPYGSRSFNWVEPRPHLVRINAEFPTRTRGVVEKCTFCDERLAEGRPPACVEACKEKALVFGDLADRNSEVRALLRERYSIRRKPELGTQPEIYYLV